VQVVGRLAPTPSGQLHLGNALAFGAAWLSVRAAGGRLLLRLEDIDRGRSRADIARDQRVDLVWLGIDWDAEVASQSARSYSAAGLPTYRCNCNRITRRAGGCPCRDAGLAEGCWRFRTPPGPVRFVDRARGACALAPGDDPILLSRDGAPTYTLAVTTDDARDGVTEVVRGADLLDATPAQIRLYEARGLEPPSYLHVPVLLGPDGRKLSKSHGSTELSALRDAGWTPERVWEVLLPLLGLPKGPLRPDLPLDRARIPAGPITIDARGQVVG
jgi:glutamyl/glutaminyl-tRNA synthetase